MNPRPKIRPNLKLFGMMILFAVMLFVVLRSDTVQPDLAQSSPGSTADFVAYFPAVAEQPLKIMIPAGTFFRGCDPAHNAGYGCPADELPLRSIYMDAFYIDTTLKTNAQYAACVTDGACTLPSDLSSKDRPYYYENPAYANYPVIYIDWYQADAYCQWAGGQLPSEAQWEKAARGSSDTRAYPWGDAFPICALANAYLGGSACIADTTEVGSYAPAANSPYGVQDLAGNVYEWLNDWYWGGYYHVAPDSNPTGPLTGSLKVRRSGAYGSTASFLRVAARIPVNPDGKQSYLGFRCVYSP
jgi:formylglycine-generating enzyme required for sulfatase activity